MEHKCGIYAEPVKLIFLATCSITKLTLKHMVNFYALHTTLATWQI